MALTDHDLSELLAALQAGSLTDTIRTSLEWILQQVIETEATARIGAERHERSESRTTQRNGHRPRLVSTPAGDVELAIPKLRKGSFFPSILERRRRIDRALFAVVMEAYVHGVSTRKVDDSVKALGVGSRISKSEVSRICAGLVTALERLNGEIKRRTNVVGIFPNDASVLRPVTAVVVETHDERAFTQSTTGATERKLAVSRTVPPFPPAGPGASRRWALRNVAMSAPSPSGPVSRRSRWPSPPSRRCRLGGEGGALGSDHSLSRTVLASSVTPASNYTTPRDVIAASRQRRIPVCPNEYRPGCGQTARPWGPAPTRMRARSEPEEVSIA